MDEQRQGGVAGDANSPTGGASGANNPPSGDANSVMATPNSNVGDADVAAAIADKITYSLTVQDAQERFAAAHRKVPSERSLQRYCEEGRIKGVRTPVTYSNGTHGSPWYINEASLGAYIRTQPMVVLGGASDANQQLA